MGTNFYAHYIPTEEDIERLHWLVDKRKFHSDWDHEDDPWDSVNNLISFINESVHLCKRSGGWKISWDHNWGKYYQPNRKSLLEFLNNGKYIIKDEYGEEISVDNFMKEMDDWDKDPHNKFDSKSYREYQIAKGDHYYDYPNTENANKCIKHFNINPGNESDFYVDNMRWSVFTDFS